MVLDALNSLIGVLLTYENTVGLGFALSHHDQNDTHVFVVGNS